MSDRIPLGIGDEPPPGSAVIVHHHTRTEIWIRPDENAGAAEWWGVGAYGGDTWSYLLAMVAEDPANRGPYLLAEGYDAAFRAGWRSGRVDMHHRLSDHIEGLALDPPTDGGAS
ncbi:MAG: hypothetical protein HOQ43_10805 [Glycomyces artemisiae]|uniref:Uncharacterized protein n=1 Tax=Glycomyces artemisiae TaxID=1076443 RepID=A0A850C4K4_9ACTN|nr:hypothetical protein [Glycomyces artemisiae]